MGKIVFWLVVAFAVLFVLRLMNASKSRRPGSPGEPPGPRQAGEATTTVRCAGCGVFLPKREARPVPQGFHCGRADCTVPAPRR